MNKYQISNRQGAWLITAAVLGTVFLPLPTLVSGVAGSAGWISVIVGYSISVVSAYFIYKTCSTYPKKSLSQINEILFGKIMGRLVNIYLFLAFFYLTAMITRQLGVLYTVSLMPRTPIIIFSASLMFLVVIILRQGLEILARVNELLLLVLVTSLIAMFILVIGDIDFDNFLPLLGKGPGAIIHGGIFTYAIAAQYVFVLGVIIPHFRNARGSFPLMLLGIICGVTVLLTVLVGTVGIFDISEVERFLYPAIQLAKVVQIGGFITGIEVVLLGGWTSASLLAISLYYYTTLSFATQVFAMPDYRELILVMAFLILAVAMVPPSAIDMLMALQKLSNIVFLPAVIVIPTALFVLSILRGNSNEK